MFALFKVINGSVLVPDLFAQAQAEPEAFAEGLCKLDCACLGVDPLKLFKQRKSFCGKLLPKLVFKTVGFFARCPYSPAFS